MKSIKIGDFEIGEGLPTKIIAEIGINHNGSLNIAKKLIDIAVNCGIDIVKFQKRDLSSLYRKDVLEDPNIEGQAFQILVPLLKKVELSEDQFKEIVSYCEQRKIMFLCTPWDKKSVDFLETLGVKAYKTASADMTNLELLEYIASKKKPMIVSTGMSHLEEIEKTVEFLKSLGAEFVLMHCNSTYPAPFRDLNLRFMKVLKEKFDVPVGYSGHERGVIMSTIAAAIGADLIERHFTLDRTMKGPDHAASLEPQGLARIVKYIKTAEIAMGSPIKKFTCGEGLMRESLAKSLVSAVDIKQGNTITKEMITVKGPGKGVSPQRRDELVGKVAKRNIPVDTNFLEEDFS